MFIDNALLPKATFLRFVPVWLARAAGPIATLVVSLAGWLRNFVPDRYSAFVMLVRAMSPETSSFFVGVVVPMPTLAVAVVRRTSVPREEIPTLPLPGVKRPVVISPTREGLGAVEVAPR